MITSKEELRVHLIIALVIMFIGIAACKNDFGTKNNNVGICVEYETRTVTKRKILSIIPTYETVEKKNCVRYKPINGGV